MISVSRLGRFYAKILIDLFHLMRIKIFPIVIRVKQLMVKSNYVRAYSILFFDGYFLIRFPIIFVISVSTLLIYSLQLIQAFLK